MLQNKTCPRCFAMSSRVFKWRWNKKKEENWLAIYCERCKAFQKKANRFEMQDSDVPDEPAPLFQKHFEFNKNI